MAAQSTTLAPEKALEEAQKDEQEALKQANVTLEKLQKWLEVGGKLGGLFLGGVLVV